MFAIPDLISASHGIPGVRIDPDAGVVRLYNAGIKFMFEDANHPGWGYGFKSKKEKDDAVPVFQSINDEEGTAFFFVNIEELALKEKKRREESLRYQNKLKKEQEELIATYIKEADSGLMPGFCME